MVFFDDPKRHVMVRVIRGVPTFDLVIYAIVYGFHIYRFHHFTHTDEKKRENVKWQSTLYGVGVDKAMYVDFAFASLTMFIGKLTTTVMLWVGTLDAVYDHRPKLSKRLILIAIGIILFFALLNMINEFQGEIWDIIFGVYSAFVGVIIAIMIQPYLKLTTEHQVDLIVEEEEMRTLKELEMKHSSQNQKGETSNAPTSGEEAG